jgi:hypothetical protein
LNRERQGCGLTLESLYWTYDRRGGAFVNEELVRVSPAVDSIRECRTALDLPECLQCAPCRIKCHLQGFFCGASKIEQPLLRRAARIQVLVNILTRRWFFVVVREFC